MENKKLILNLIITIVLGMCIYLFLYYKISKFIQEEIADDIKLVNVDGKVYHFKMNKSTNAYEIDSKPVIWLYWHNIEKMPDYVKILIEITACINPTFEIIIVNEQRVTAFWPDCYKDIFRKLSPAHQSDLFRVHVLKIFGGIYLDVDTFAISSLAPFYDLLLNHHLVGTDWKPMKSQLSVGHLGPVRTNTSLFNIWAYWQDEIIRGKAVQLQKSPYPLQWSELLSDIAIPLAAHLDNHKLMRYFKMDGLQTVGQLIQFGLADDVLQPLKSSYLRLKQLRKTPLLYFHNSKHAKLLTLNASELLEQSEAETIFGFLSKCALVKCYETTRSDKNMETNLTKLNVKFLIQIIETFKTLNDQQYRCLF